MEPSACTNDTTHSVEDEPLEPLDKASNVQKEASDFRQEIMELGTNNLPRRSLLNLPVEVWCMILGFLPDKKDVRAAVHSCPELLSLWYVATPS